MHVTSALARLAVGATLVALSAGCSDATAEPQSRSGEPSPTVVLVHGAFADSSSWNGVIERLRRDGYPVIAAANPLRGLRSDADYVASVLDTVPGPVVLAGHSYGGSVMSQAAVGHPNVKALVFIASFILEPGESTAELAGRFVGAQLGPALESAPVALPNGNRATDLSIRPDQFRAVFAADVAPEITDLMAVTQRPITEEALNEPATAAAWKTVPSWNMVTTADLAIPAESMRFMGDRAKSHTVEIDASHAVTVSQPAAVADLIGDAARSTAA